MKKGIFKLCFSWKIYIKWNILVRNICKLSAQKTKVILVPRQMIEKYNLYLFQVLAHKMNNFWIHLPFKNTRAMSWADLNRIGNADSVVLPANGPDLEPLPSCLTGNWRPPYNVGCRSRTCSRQHGSGEVIKSGAGSCECYRLNIEPLWSQVLNTGLGIVLLPLRVWGGRSSEITIKILSWFPLLQSGFVASNTFLCVVFDINWLYYNFGLPFQLLVTEGWHLPECFLCCWCKILV